MTSQKQDMPNRSLCLQKGAQGQAVQGQSTRNKMKTWTERKALTLFSSAIFCMLSTSNSGLFAVDVQGAGVVVESEGGGPFSVNTRVDGIIRQVEVKWGQDVKKGQILATIYDHDYDTRFAKAKLTLKKVAAEYEKLKKEISVEEEAETKSMKAQLSTNLFNQEQIARKIDKLKDALDQKNVLFNKGLVSSSAVDDIETQISSARIERETVKASAADIRFNLLKGYRTDDLRAKLNELVQAQDDNEMLTRQEHYYKLESPKDGQVLEVLVSDGQIIQRGIDLMIISAKGDPKSPLRVYAFFDMNEGKLIQVGQTASVALPSFDPAVYGTLSGKVVQVSPAPLSSTAVGKILLNPNLASVLTGDKPVIAAVIELQSDPSSKEYQFSKGKKTPVPLTPGFTAVVTVDRG